MGSTPLWRSRDEAKKVKNEPLSQALKLLMNSFAGVQGASECRFFNPELVSAVTLRGHELADGGLIESVPFRAPLSEGATHVLALRSRDAAYRKGRRGRVYGFAEDRVINRLPGKVPAMIRARPARYDADAAALQTAQRGEGPDAGRVLQLTPSADVPLVGRLETDADKARAAMRAGALVVLDALARPAT